MSRCRFSGRHGLLRGAGLVLIGVLFLLLNLGVLESHVFRTWWPLLLIAAGAARLFVYAWRGNRSGGPYSNFA